ncbi:uncharacterized protein RJT20DRAFT_95514 [Scheffersomyces xylosifermentans]|uniref:uncharacterized protein n=1 Tax=Scheffersomyces xylosifermentans TaxID=1304137 RepID=UPI00315D7511
MLNSNKPPQSSFTKESILPASDPRSPFHINLPSFESKPIDDLVNFFKYWKYFVRSLIAYFKEIALVKEFEANLNYQLINSIQFPGYKDLPRKVLQDLNNGHNSPPSQSQSGTPPHELKKVLSSSSIATVTGASQNPEKRPGLFKTKSNTTFLKHTSSVIPPLHKKTPSFGSNGTNKNANININNTNKSPAPTPYNNDIKIAPTFFPDDSLFKCFPSLLISQHQTQYLTSLKLQRDLTNKFIPRLETLLRQLSGKIKEIKSSLRNDSFANPELAIEVSKTGQLLSRYMDSVARYNAPKPVLKKNVVLEDDMCEDDEETGVLDDPFLLKLKVDYQLKNQLIMENYSYASYVNLQNIARDLLTHVLKELNIIVDKFGKLQFNQEFYQYLKTKISASSQADWEYFISHNPSFLNVYKTTPVSRKQEIRSFKTLTLPYHDSIHNKCIRFGVLYKKSKILKNYNRYYYLLTCNYLHEFRFENENGKDKEGTTGETKKNTAKKSKEKVGGFIGHDDVPVKSYNLNDYFIKSKDDKIFKFQLTKTSNPSHKFTFKCLDATEYENWVEDLSELLKFGCRHLERFNLVESKIRGRELEHAKQKELKQRDTFAHERNFHLNLGSSSNLVSSNPTSDAAFSGMFTPRVKTPIGSVEGNPFDSNFFNDFPTSSYASTSTLSSPNLSPRDSLVNLANAQSLHQQQHESYMKIHQEFLKQQQDLLASRMRELEQMQNVNGDSASGLRSPSSAESMNSFVLPNQDHSGAMNLINANQDLLNKDRHFPVRFSLAQENDDQDSNPDYDQNGSNTRSGSQTPVPTLLVSNNH